MIHKDAVQVALETLRALKPACERICIAGSVRRHKPHCKDVELVFMPQFAKQRVDLFTEADVSRLDWKIQELITAGFWQFDREVRRNGPKYKRLVHSASSMTIELFRADPRNWGLQMVLRTGPADFNHLLVNRFGGAMPVDMVMDGGYLWRRGQKIPTPTETAFFEALGLPYVAPQERSAEWLRAHLESRRNDE